MVIRSTLILILMTVVFSLVGIQINRADDKEATAQQSVTSLPAPETKGKVSVEEALAKRRSVRTYSTEPVTLQQVSQLLWAAQGITEPTKGLRTAPSAVATYPLRVYLFAGNVKDLPAGVYEYIPKGHKLQLVMEGDQRTNVGSQPQMQTAPALFVYVADYTNTASRFGKDKAKEWAFVEAGHSAQNVLLEEVALGMIGVPMGGFDADKLRSTLKLGENQDAIYVVSAALKKE
ncbi:MAG TPA: SagB/ThcOx family dehydrogenase [Armatimonadota bacterium]|nr:SagB/ThcOx family dehydrogenase [Armatimonadota bacterium]